MSRNKFGVKMIAIMLCLAVILPFGTVATGEEIQDSTTASSSQNPSTLSNEPETLTTQEPMKVSDELLRVLKQLEGFRPHAYWDYKQRSIGYGSKCPEGYVSYYQSNPISEAYAE